MTPAQLTIIFAFLTYIPLTVAAILEHYGRLPKRAGEAIKWLSIASFTCGLVSFGWWAWGVE